MEFVYLNTAITFFFFCNTVCGRIRLFVFWSCCCLHWMVLDGLRADGCTLFLSEEIPVEPSKTSCGDPSIPAWEFHGFRQWYGLLGVPVWHLNPILLMSNLVRTGQNFIWKIKNDELCYRIQVGKFQELDRTNSKWAQTRLFFISACGDDDDDDDDDWGSTARH